MSTPGRTISPNATYDVQDVQCHGARCRCCICADQAIAQYMGERSPTVLSSSSPLPSPPTPRNRHQRYMRVEPHSFDMGYDLVESGGSSITLVSSPRSPRSHSGPPHGYSSRESSQYAYDSPYYHNGTWNGAQNSMPLRSAQHSPRGRLPRRPASSGSPVYPSDYGYSDYSPSSWSRDHNYTSSSHGAAGSSHGYAHGNIGNDSGYDAVQSPYSPGRDAFLANRTYAVAPRPLPLPPNQQYGPGTPYQFVSLLSDSAAESTFYPSSKAAARFDTPMPGRHHGESAENWSFRPQLHSTLINSSSSRGTTPAARDHGSKAHHSSGHDTSHRSTGHSTRGSSRRSHRHNGNTLVAPEITDFSLPDSTFAPSSFSTPVHMDSVSPRVHNDTPRPRPMTGNRPASAGHDRANSSPEVTRIYEQRTPDSYYYESEVTSYAE